MMKYCYLLICFVLLLTQSFAFTVKNDWQYAVNEEVKIKSPDKCIYKNVIFNSGAARSFTAHIVTFQAGSYKAEIVDQPIKDETKFNSVAKIVTGRGAIAGVNGGFFTKEFTPNGLCVIEGEMLASIKRLKSPVLAGILLIDKNGEVSLSPAINFTPAKDRFNFALQAGPFLLTNDGQLSGEMTAAGFIAKQQTKHTVLALGNDNQLLVISTSAASLIDLAECLRSLPVAFGVKRVLVALSLDGGRSAALTVRLPGRTLELPEGWPVRNAVAISLL